MLQVRQPAASQTSQALTSSSHEKNIFDSKEVPSRMSLTMGGNFRSQLSNVLKVCFVMISLQVSLQMPMDSTRAVGLRKWMIGEDYSRRDPLFHLALIIPLEARFT